MVVELKKGKSKAQCQNSRRAKEQSHIHKSRSSLCFVVFVGMTDV